MLRRKLEVRYLVLLLGVVTACAGLVRPALSTTDAELWRAIRTGEAVAIMRHALAPGTGDPASFQVDDCSTQRNLSERGREQARQIGDRFRANGIETARVVSSQWCRCLDTAKLLGLGDVEELAALNSFFENRERRGPQTRALQAWLADAASDTPLVLVTHQVNISALTGDFTSSGEVIVFRRGPEGGIEVLGSL